MSPWEPRQCHWGQLFDPLLCRLRQAAKHLGLCSPEQALAHPGDVAGPGISAECLAPEGAQFASAHPLDRLDLLAEVRFHLVTFSCAGHTQGVLGFDRESRPFRLESAGGGASEMASLRAFSARAASSRV